MNQQYIPQPTFFISETKNPLTLEAYRIKMAFFTSEMLTEVCRRLVHNYFQLTVEDLQIWDSEPEDFSKDKYTLYMLEMNFIT